MYSTDNVAYFYLSLDQDISPGDIYLGSQSFNDLEPNSGIEINPSLKIPANMTEGDYYLLIQVRGQQNDGIPLENNLSNNTVSVKINLTRSANVLSLDDENNSHILIYPNPLLYGKLLTVELDYKAVMLIFSIEGRMVKKEALSVGKNHIDLDALPKGNYLLKCISKDRTDEAKIIIR